MTLEGDDWDAAAASFDDEADHGLRDPDIRAAWARLLLRKLPSRRCSVLDLGCGTGTLSVLLATHGHAVTGVDLSAAMLEHARAKADAEHADIAWIRGDAADPPVSGLFDVVLCRHVLWALPDPEQTLMRWKARLRSPGQLILIEGLWSTGAGMSATDLLPLIERVFGATNLEHLGNAALWGRQITDERYLVSATA